MIAALAAGCGSSDTANGPTSHDPHPRAAPLDPASPRSPPCRTRDQIASPTRPRLLVVDHVVDGDTIDLANGAKVRLLQIDTPETTQGECYSGQAESRLASLVHPGARVSLRADPALDRTRPLRAPAALRLSRRSQRQPRTGARGAATVWFYQGDRGRFAQRLLSASRRARRAKRGLWGACPHTPFDPEQGADTGGGSAGSGGAGASGDKDCSDFSSQREAQRFFKAHGGPRSDPDRLDADHNGVACESL